MAHRIVTVTGRGLPIGVDADGYDTRLAADAQAEQAHDGEYRIEAYEDDAPTEDLRGGATRLPRQIVIGRGQAGSWAGLASPAGHDDMAAVVGSTAFEKVLAAGLARGVWADGGLVGDGWLLVTEMVDPSDDSSPYPDESDLDGDEAVIAYCAIPEVVTSPRPGSRAEGGVGARAQVAALPPAPTGGAS